MREIITRFGRHNIGVLWLIAEPMIFTMGVATLWTFAGMAHTSVMPVVAFAVTGYSSVLLWRNTVGRCNAGVQQNISLLFHRNVRVLDVFITRIILEVAGATASFLILTTAFVLTGLMPFPQDALTSTVGWVLLAWFGGALAILVGSAASYSEVVDRIWHPTAYLLFPLAGAAFMVDWLPVSMQELVLLLPMVHGVEMVRDGFYGHLVRTHYDVGYFVLVNLVLTLLGLLLSRLISRRVKSGS